MPNNDNDGGSRKHMAAEKHAHDTTNIEPLRQALERSLDQLERLRQEVAGWREDLAALRQDLDAAYQAGELGDTPEA